MSEERDRAAAEVERLRGVYAGRAASEQVRRHNDPGNPGTAWNLERRGEAVATLLRRHLGASLAGIEVLDVGCGSGGLLDDLQPLDVAPERFWGVDLMLERIEAARRNHPAAHFTATSAHHLPFPDARFDLVAQFMLMSSILDGDMRTAVAREMDRVLKPAGHILWYDSRFHPTNRDARGIRRRELTALFPGYTIDARPATLIPPLARAAGAHAPILLAPLHAIPLLRSHTIAILRKPPE